MTTPPPAKISLKDKLVVLNAEQYQAVFAIYGQTGLDKYDTLVKSNVKPEEFQGALASFIKNDSSKKQKSKLTALIDEYYKEYNAEKDTLDDLTLKAREAAKAKNDFKKVFKSNTATFTKSIEDLVSGTNKDLLDQRKRQQEAMAAWAKRDKMRKQGKKAYLRGLVAAVIDNCEKEYEAQVTKEANVKVKAAKAVIASGEIDDPRSEKGTKEIMALCFPPEKKRLFQVEAAQAGLDFDNTLVTSN